jgi:ankyrin repeat protein
MKTAHYALCAFLLLMGQNRSFGNALADALRAGDRAAFARALRDSAPNLNAVDDRGFTPLMHAARFGTGSEMRELLDRGADPNFQSADKVTAFNFAVDDIRKARLLVERGFDFKKFDAEQLSPLMIAAGHPRGFETVKYSVAQGANVRATNGIGISAVGRAAAIGEAGTISFLVEQGAPADTIYRFVDGTSSTPLLTALGGGHKKAALYLAKRGAPLNVSDQFLGHSLAYALACGLPDVARELVERGADIRASNNIGEVPPILFAAYNERGDASMVKLLLEKGADINSHNDTDETALTWARKRGETDLVRFLEQRGAKDTAAPRRRLPIPANNFTLTRDNRHALLEASVDQSLAILTTSSDFSDARDVRTNAFPAISKPCPALPSAGGRLAEWLLTTPLCANKSRLRQTCGERRWQRLGRMTTRFRGPSKTSATD